MADGKQQSPPIMTTPVDVAREALCEQLRSGIWNEGAMKECTHFIGVCRDIGRSDIDIADGLISCGVESSQAWLMLGYLNPPYTIRSIVRQRIGHAVGIIVLILVIIVAVIKPKLLAIEGTWLWVLVMLVLCLAGNWVRLEVRKRTAAKEFGRPHL
jgi:hypothetical protein